MILTTHFTTINWLVVSFVGISYPNFLLGSRYVRSFALDARPFGERKLCVGRTESLYKTVRDHGKVPKEA